MGFANLMDEDSARRRLLDLGRVFDHMPLGFCVFDADFRYVYVNEALATLNGLPPEGHVGRSIHDVLPHVASFVEVELGRVLTTGKPVISGMVEAETPAAPGVKKVFQHTYAAVMGEGSEVIGVSCLVNDVSSQRRTRDALRQSEESLELSLDAASIGTWSWDLVDGTHFWDSRMLSMSGHLVEDHTGVMADDFIKSLHPDDVAMVEEAARRSLEDDADYNIDYRIIRRDDGEERFINARALVIRDDGGEAVRMTGVAIDVTERKRTEAELQLAHDSLEGRVAERTQTLNDANLRLQEQVAERNLAEAARLEGETFIDTVISNMVDAVITIDTSGRVSSFNQTAEIIFGYEPTEVIGQSINMLMPEPDHSRHDEYLSDYMDTGRSTIIDKGPREVLGRHRDGRTLNLELAISRTSFGGQPLFVGSLRDISARKQLEALFKIVAEHTPNSIVLKDLEGRFVLVNRRFENWLGFHPGELSGKLARDIYPPDYFEAINLEDQKVARSGHIDTREWEVMFADGQIHRVLATKFPVTDANGVVIGVGTVGMDVSDLRNVESQLLQAQKMEAIGQLTGGIAHDFNNLLAVMLGNLSLLQEDLGPDHQSADLLAPTMRAVNQATALTARMLAFSRQQSLEVRQVEANDLLLEMQPLIKRSLVEQIEFTFVLAPDVYKCQVDPGQLEQAILNLSINARDAMHQGGNLRIETANVTFDEDDKKRPIEMPPGDYVRISVSDDGSGIAAGDIEKIFDPFFTTKSVGEGTGLGLSMVYGFIKQSDGHITVETEEGVGTTFHLFLAADATPAGVPAQAEPVKIATTANEIILVVEDEEDVRSMVAMVAMVAMVLEKEGYQLLLARNGQEGLDTLARSSNVELLLTDVLLSGGMNGQQVADMARVERAGLKVLFMSGYSRDAIVQQGRLNADVQLLRKPFSPGDLTRRVREILDS